MLIVATLIWLQLCQMAYKLNKQALNRGKKVETFPMVATQRYKNICNEVLIEKIPTHTRINFNNTEGMMVTV